MDGRTASSALVGDRHSRGDGALQSARRFRRCRVDPDAAEVTTPSAGLLRVRPDLWEHGDVAKGGNLQRAFEKYAVNPVMRLLLRLGLAPNAFALLETTGRRSGALRLTPIGNGLDGSVFWLVSEHGMGCDYEKNVVANPQVRVKVRRTWYRGNATLVPDGDSLTRRRALDNANGLIGRADGVIFRASASAPATVRIDLDGCP
jgi:deazaflavin-dependent oxidoreductase (nitroreductase family)